MLSLLDANLARVTPNRLYDCTRNRKTHRLYPYRRANDHCEFADLDAVQARKKKNKKTTTKKPLHRVEAKMVYVWK